MQDEHTIHDITSVFGTEHIVRLCLVLCHRWILSHLLANSHYSIIPANLYILRDAHLFGQDLISGSGKSGLYFWPVLLFTLFQRRTVDTETPQKSATCLVVIKLFITSPPAAAPVAASSGLLSMPVLPHRQ